MNVRGVLAAAAIVASALAATAASPAQQPAAAKAPAQQPAPVDHLWFRLDPVPLSGGWKLQANATSPDYYLTWPFTVPVTPAEIISLYLSRRLSRRADESHIAAVHLADATISFDGRDGRWDTRGASASPVSGGSPLLRERLAVNMTITAVGEPEQLGPDEYLPWGCHGPSLARVRVMLTGTFALRTGMEAFKTIRRTQLTGTMTYNQGGPLECGLPAPAQCEPTTSLWSQYELGSSRNSRAYLYVDRGRRFLSVQFTDRAGWTHIMAVHELDVLGGEPPTIRGRLPANRPIRGSFRFAARETTESVDGPCSRTTTKGTLTGKLRAVFTRWGTEAFLRWGWRLDAIYQVVAPV